jgi:hypothetical protein
MRYILFFLPRAGDSRTRKTRYPVWPCSVEGWAHCPALPRSIAVPTCFQPCRFIGVANSLCGLATALPYVNCTSLRPSWRHNQPVSVEPSQRGPRFSTRSIFSLQNGECDARTASRTHDAHAQEHAPCCLCRVLLPTRTT